MFNTKSISKINESEKNDKRISELDLGCPSGSHSHRKATKLETLYYYSNDIETL